MKVFQKFRFFRDGKNTTVLPALAVGFSYPGFLDYNLVNIVNNDLLHEK